MKQEEQLDKETQASQIVALQQIRDCLQKQGEAGDFSSVNAGAQKDSAVEVQEILLASGKATAVTAGYNNSTSVASKATNKKSQSNATSSTAANPTYLQLLK